MGKNIKQLCIENKSICYGDYLYVKKHSLFTIFIKHIENDHALVKGVSLDNLIDLRGHEYEKVNYPITCVCNKCGNEVVILNSIDFGTFLEHKMLRINKKGIYTYENTYHWHYVHDYDDYRTCKNIGKPYIKKEDKPICCQQDMEI